MKPGSWSSIALIYLHGVLAAASLSKIIPLLADLALHLGASPAQFGLLISLMTVAPAVLAAPAGSIIDRAGARNALTVAAAIGAAVNLAYLLVGSLHAFMAIRVVEGLVVVGIYSAAPALIMATAGAARRGRAMAVWSTYTPVGVSLGLALSALSAGSSHWRGSYLIHMVLFVGLVLAGRLLPHVPIGVQQGANPRPGLLAALQQPGPVRLALTFCALLMMGFGMSTVFPDWMALQHQMPVGQASSVLALTNLTMIPGGIAAGALLSGGQREGRLLCVLMGVAVLASVPLFMPSQLMVPRMAGLLVWLLVQGAALGVVTYTLPRVVANPMQGAAAAGLLSQLAALTTFVTPLIWRPILQSGNWLLFTAVVLVCSGLAILLFPRTTAGH